MPKKLWLGRSLQNLESLDLSNNLLTGQSDNFDFERFGESWKKLTSLRLNDNFFRGYTSTYPDSSLPWMIAKNLQSLKILDISKSFFSGKLPHELFSSKNNMKVLNLGNSGLSFDTLDSTQVLQNITSQLSSLEQLDLSNCFVRGSIPTTIGSLRQLNFLKLDGDFLEGTIPTEIGNLAALATLGLSNRRLRGTIPTEIGSLVGLKELDFSESKLTGTIPREIESLHQLKLLRLQRNRLTGTIPTEISSLVELQDFDLSSNRLTGRTPSEIGYLTNLKVLRLKHNELNGAIPIEISKSVGLKNLELSGNKLTGYMPSEIGSLIKLQTLDLSYNKFNGTISTELGSLVSLEFFYLWKNQFTGTVPSEIGNLVGLQRIDISSNQFSGGITPEIGSLVGLESLALSRNQFTGTIPSEFGGLLQLQTLYLRSNKFAGTIPPEIGSLVRLEYVSLERNKLTGTVPSEIGYLFELRSLDLRSNKLSGKIPSEIGSMAGLTDIYLLRNDFSGTIPPQIEKLDKLDGLDLSFNSFSGSIPLSICKTKPYIWMRVDCEDVICYCCSCKYSRSPSASPSTSQYPTAPSFSPSSSSMPSSSPAPTHQEVIVTIEIQLDRYPQETGWNITDSNGNAIYQSSFGTYSTDIDSRDRDYRTTGEKIYEKVSLAVGLDYTFNLLDSVGDGLRGDVILYLGETPDVTRVLGYYDSCIESDGDYYRGCRYNTFYSYHIQFTAGEEGILENIFPTASPSTSNFPTLTSSLHPSLAPSTSVAPTQEVIVTIEIQLDRHPQQTGWNITDSNGNTIHEIPFGTYAAGSYYKTPDDTVSEKVYEKVSLTVDFEYTFNILDSAGTGLEGSVFIYLGETPDVNRVLGYYDYSMDLYPADCIEEIDSYYYSRSRGCRYYGFSSRRIQFTAGEEGIITNIPTASPSTSNFPTNSLVPSEPPTASRRPSSSQIPSYVPSSSPAPTRETIHVTVEIQLDNWQDETGWNIRDEDNNVVHKISFGTLSNYYSSEDDGEAEGIYTYEDGKTVYTESISLDIGLDYTFDLLDSYGDGLRGRVIIYLGETPDANQILGYYLDSGEEFSAHAFVFRACEEGIIQNVFPTAAPTDEPSFFL